jgi:hypothetical protein
LADLVDGQQFKAGPFVVSGDHDRDLSQRFGATPALTSPSWVSLWPTLGDTALLKGLTAKLRAKNAPDGTLI